MTFGFFLIILKIYTLGNIYLQNKQVLLCYILFLVETKFEIYKLNLAQKFMPHHHKKKVDAAK